jgi:hypothetical protein
MKGISDHADLPIHSILFILFILSKRIRRVAFS